jgi:aspartyl-tRNA(Asn)/glutamyl-tRNA(Gln) amidotransferase subunit C
VIDKNQVKKIAELARLKVEDEDIEKFSKDLSSVLSYIEDLNSADVAGVEPTLHASSQKNVFRSDDKPDEQDVEFAKKLVDSAPDSEDGYIKVKSILK